MEKDKKIRLKLRLSQEELASKSDLSHIVIDRYEKESIHPSKNSLLKLNKIIDLNYLCTDDHSKFMISDYVKYFKNWRQTRT